MKRLSEHAFIFATLSPRPTPCWRNLCASHQSLLTCSIPYARQCPDCARARSDMIPVLVFSYIIHLATTYLYMERKRVYDLVMPFPAPPLSPFLFRSPPPDIWTRVFIHDIQHAPTLALTHHIRVIPWYCWAVPLVYLFISHSRILGLRLLWRLYPTNLTTLFTIKHHYIHGEV